MEIYLDETTKPAKGESLNKECEITLYYVWPNGKSHEDHVAKVSDSSVTLTWKWWCKKVVMFYLANAADRFYGSTNE